MDKKNDGGPAFPYDVQRNGRGYHDGMSLRDWFAGQIMNGFVSDTDGAGFVIDKEETQETARKRYWETIVKTSYEIADIMLAERAK